MYFRKINLKVVKITNISQVDFGNLSPEILQKKKLCESIYKTVKIDLVSKRFIKNFFKSLTINVLYIKLHQMSTTNIFCQK